MQPITFVFGGKAATGCCLSRLNIKLINAVGNIVNREQVEADNFLLFGLSTDEVAQLLRLGYLVS